MKRVFILITVLAFARLSFAISPIEDYYWSYLFEETTFDVSHQKIGELYYDLSSESRLAQVVATGEGETPYGGAVTIPEKVVYENEDYTVFAIGHHAFRDCNNITEVFCSDSIRIIYYEAFKECGNLSKIRMSKNISVICSYSFKNCEKLSKVIIPDIASWCRVIMHAGGQLGYTATPFHYGRLYDENEEEITELTIPEGVTLIADYAFMECRSLRKVSIPSSVKQLGVQTFYQCSNLKEVIFPEESAFTTIPQNCFAYCSSLSSLRIPEGVETIEGSAFNNCPSIEVIDIPRSLKKTGGDAFFPCHSLKQVNIADLKQWCTIDFGRDGVPRFPGAGLYVGGEEVKDLRIPDGVTTLCNYLFSGFRLTSLDLNQVETIGSGAFMYCGELETVTFTDTPCSIGVQAFCMCQALSVVKLTAGVKEIGLFAFSNCSMLKDLYYDTKGFPEIGKLSPFEDTPIENATLHVPEDMIETFRETAPWSGFGQIVALQPGDMPDGIEVPLAPTPRAGAAIYDLQGRRLNSRPEKGVYIVNGRKVMIK